MKPIIGGKHLDKQPRLESTRRVHPARRISFLGGQVFREIGVEKGFAGDVEDGYFLGLEPWEKVSCNLVIPECAVQRVCRKEVVEFDFWVRCIETLGSDDLGIGIRCLPLAERHVMLYYQKAQ
jgi:hypothetical protein